MKRASVKLRVSLMLTLLMALLALLLLGMMLSVSSSVALRTSMNQLSSTVRGNLGEVALVDGRLALGENFHFSLGGVSTLIYNRREALIAGQPPVAFTVSEPFRNGLARVVGDGQWLVLDLWLANGWEDGVWLRGLMERPDNRQVTDRLLMMALITLPVFLLLAAVGSWSLTRRALRPLDSIMTAADTINEARDLEGRIALSEGSEEFVRLADTFDRMFERLERSFEAEKQFTADASHELRTPISIIKGACEYSLKFDETDEERQETLTMIHRQAERMAELVNQLLRMTRLEQGLDRAGLTSLDLGQLVLEVAEEQGWEPPAVTVETAPAVTVAGDAALLTRLLLNLTENAMKYGGEGRRVWVRVLSKDGEALLSVEDDGIGIPADSQEQIWQRFYQVDPSRSGGGGLGLGLSMVRQIARLHNGRMSLRSAPGEGSCFTLHLPLAASSKK